MCRIWIADTSGNRYLHARYSDLYLFSFRSSQVPWMTGLHWPLLKNWNDLSEVGHHPSKKIFPSTKNCDKNQNLHFNYNRVQAWKMFQRSGTPLQRKSFFLLKILKKSKLTFQLRQSERVEAWKMFRRSFTTLRRKSFLLLKIVTNLKKFF